MAKNTIADLDTTTSNNQDVLGQSTLGSADANQLDAVDRATLSLLARFYADLGGVATVGGSANAITVTSASTYQALETGLVLSFKASAANTGATTLNLDGLGVKAVRRKGDSALSAGDMAANGRYLVVYDAAYNSAAGAWVLMNPEPPTTAAPTTVDLGGTTDTTLSRAAAGVLAVEGNLVPSPASQDTGDVLYRGASEWARLAKGADGQILTLASGLPSWAAAPSGGQPVPTNSTYAVGTLLTVKNVSGSAVADGATVAGSSLQTMIMTSTPSFVVGLSLTGTWKNVAGLTASNNNYYLFVRTA